MLQALINCALKSSIICFQCSYMLIIILEYYKRISGNKQKQVLKIFEIKMTKPLVCVVSFLFASRAISRPFWLVLKILSCTYHIRHTRVKEVGSPISHYSTLYSLSVFSLAKSLQLILEISATYRLVSSLLVSD